MTFSMSELHNTSTKIIMEEVFTISITFHSLVPIFQEAEEDAGLSAKEAEEEKKKAKELQAKYVGRTQKHIKNLQNIPG